MKRSLLMMGLLVTMASASCDCTSEAGGVGNAGSSDVDSDEDVALDAALVSDALVSDADGPSDVDLTDARPGDVEVMEDAGESADGCGLYQAECDGVCIPVSMDPDNCGGCGVVCEAGDVCSGGKCVDSQTCPPGMTACDRRCTDMFWDSDHCGRCENSCGEGTGCVGGQCRPQIALGPAPAFCEGGGPPLDIVTDAAGPGVCAGNLAEATFRFGVCSCDGLTTNNAFMVDAYDSNLGPYTPGGPGGGAGTNGAVDFNNPLSVTGTLWSSGGSGIVGNSRAQVGQRLYSGGQLRLNGGGVVGDDAWVEGNINASGLDIGGTLYVTPGSTRGAGLTYADLVERDFSVADPCTACAPEERIDIAGIVAARRDHNDNDLIGLDPDVFVNSNGNVRLELPCGHYYLSRIHTNGPTTIVATGNTVLYVGGDVTPNNELTLSLSPNAQFDVFVAGNVTINNDFRLGSANYPALMRLYVGGANGFRSNNPITVGGYVYAVPGGITTNNEAEVYGGLYAQELRSNNEVKIHYDRAVATVGRTCPDPGRDPDPMPEPDPDAGVGDTSPGPDSGPGPDPQPEPRCQSTGGTCSNDADCCAPLACNGGTCSLLSCQPAYGPCSSNAECCSQLCAQSGSGQGMCIVN
jgi:hypothetical protein